MDNETCVCGHVWDEHDPEDLFCEIELEDGTHCPCIHFESADSESLATEDL